jgi:putative FmdB family regulatory protein
MPIYEYTCKDCGSDFELLIRGAEKPVCPSCGKTHLAKSFSVPAAHSASETKELPCGSPGCGMAHQCGGGMCGLGH